MQYRNIRVEDLSPDAPGRTRPGRSRSTGAGPHTVEVRSIDAAGNVEEKKALDFEIGEVRAARDPARASRSTPVPPMTDTPASAAFGELASRVSAKRFGKRGLTVPVACTGAMEGTATLKLSKRSARSLKAGQADGQGGARCGATARTRPRSSSSRPRSLKRKLGASGARAAAARARSKLTLTVKMTDLGQPTQTLKKTHHDPSA